MWSRIFGLIEDEPSPGMMLEHLQECGFPVSANLKGDDLGWTAAEIFLGKVGDSTPDTPGGEHSSEPVPA